MKVLSVVGTRPNFLKELAFHEALARTDATEVVVHTGQHSMFQMSQLFFEELSLPEPSYHADLPSGSSTEQLGWMLPWLEQILLAESPDVTLVYGDVTSTAAGAWAAARLGIPVAHVEGGIRTEARTNPEEINRRLADHLSDVVYPNTRHAHDALLAEGFPAGDVILPGDIVADIVRIALERFGIEVRRGDYCLATVHRAENADDPARLGKVLTALVDADRPIVFPLHPRTRATMEAHELFELLAGSRVEVVDPLGYGDFQRLLAGCDRVVSDSGGVRREAYILGKPVVSLIEFVWVPAMVQAGWELVAGGDPALIAEGLLSFEPPEARPAIFGDGHAADRIVASLGERYG